MTVKPCQKCGIEKPLEDFAKDTRYKNGRRGTCKRCHTDYMISYYAKNEKQRKEKNKINSKHRPAWKRHKITEDQWTNLYNKYDGKCHSCKERNAYAIDHDHSCCNGNRSKCGNCIRGILCNQCNTALGLLNDNKEYIMRLVNYIAV
jgi:hypothetical protein